MATAVKGYVDAGYLAEFDTLEDCEAFVGGTPVLNKLGKVIRHKWSDGKWTTKARLIMDSKQSGLKYSTRKQVRTVLPRVSDAIHSSLDFMATAFHNQSPADEDMEQLVLDVTDAFWAVPTRPDERRFVTISFGGKWLVFMRTPQGTTGAPLAWDILFGLSCRCAQSMFVFNDSSQDILRLQVYVDDPWAVIRGNQLARDRAIAKLILTWRVLGFPLSFSKGKRGKALIWIGAKITLGSLEVIAEITEAKIAELKQITSELLATNVPSIKAVR
jgi:hypothetical protein